MTYTRFPCPTCGDLIICDEPPWSCKRESCREKSLPERYKTAIAALKLAEPALRTLRDGHCDCKDCKYTLALNAVVAALKGAK